MCAPLNDYIHTQLFSYPQVKRMKILDQFQECIAWETAVKQSETTRKKMSNFQILQNTNWGNIITVFAVMLILIPKAQFQC